MVSSVENTAVGIPLLSTKLYVPKWRSGLVSRPRLVERLTQGTTRKLTVISAPAGFGKTTLLAEWLAANPASDRSATWVSLDETDNDPILFWTYLITALQRIRSEIGRNALPLLHSPQPPPIESILTTLINDIAASNDEIVLILDDVHVINAPQIHHALAFLLDYLPPHMHLVLATRSDPPLPLARLRGRGDATEVRAADLRFTSDETAGFLEQVMGLDLSAGDVAILETRTEGWIAGLQLAGLSLQDRADVTGFIRSFAGDDRYIVDYLVEEVLQRQPEQVRSFLLQTSMLDRLSGPLCNVVTGRDDSKEVLETLERGNLFVVPLDDKRHWYRYHHLFADVLRAHARAEPTDYVAARHRRASEWFEENGLRTEAIRHALVAGDVSRAADLVELSAMTMLGSSQESSLHRWLEALPDDVISARPVLSVYSAFAVFGRGLLDVAEERLQDAERWLEMPMRGTDPSTAAKMIVVDEAVMHSLPGIIAIGRGYLCGARGDVQGTVTYARRALDVLPTTDNLWRGAAGALLGIAYWTTGNLVDAFQSFLEGMNRLSLAGHERFQIACTYILADIQIAQGRLREAIRTYEQALHLATAQSEPIWGTVDLYVGLSALACERNDLDTALRFHQHAVQLGEHAGSPETRHRVFLAKARIEEALGNLDGALEQLDEAARSLVIGPDPILRPIPALKTRVWLLQGRLADAVGWAQEHTLSVNDDLSYLREFEHLTLARVLMAQGQRASLHDAQRLLDRLLAAAEAGERPGSVIEILISQALAFATQGDIAQALPPLERALLLAEPEGYVRLFVGEGAAIRPLLHQATAKGIATTYTRRLLAILDASSQSATASASLPEPLTGREIEILRLIAAGLRNEEIADHLFISLSTVKRHIANAYGKLGVGHRVEAVARANDLKLL